MYLICSWVPGWAILNFDITLNRKEPALDDLDDKYISILNFKILLYLWILSFSERVYDNVKLQSRYSWARIFQTERAGRYDNGTKTLYLTVLQCECKFLVPMCIDSSIPSVLVMQHIQEYTCCVTLTDEVVSLEKFPIVWHVLLKKGLLFMEIRSKNNWIIFPWNFHEWKYSVVFF